MKKYYLIDTENVGDRWIELIDHLTKKHVLVVFYTKYHSRLLEECYLKQRYNRQIRWVECEVGNNALDQQLMGVLSYLISAHPEAEYAIFSNDKDYQNVIDFWKQRNLKVERVGYDISKKKDKCEKAAGHQPTSQKSSNGQQIAGRKSEGGQGSTGQKAGNGQGAADLMAGSEQGATDPKAGSGQDATDQIAENGQRTTDPNAGAVQGATDPNTGARQGATDLKAGQKEKELQEVSGMTEEQVVVEIARLIPTASIGNWYVVLTSLLGMDAGRDCYIRLRDDKERQQELSQYLIPNVDERNVQLIAWLYKVHQLDTARAKPAYKIVKAHNKKNKKAIKADFDKQFGKTGQAQYYKVIKPIVGVLKEK